MDGWTRALVVCCVAFLAGAAPARATTETYTSGCWAFAVPRGVGSVTIAASGAQGADGLGSTGGKGDRVTATLGITYPETLFVCAGEGGAPGSGNAGHGGGASGVAVGTDFSRPVVIAGGGGGGGDATINAPASAGGAAGNPVGAPGASNGGASANDGTNGSLALGGGGGTQAAPGDGGLAFAPGDPGQATTSAGPGAGGAGGSSDAMAAGGGGGGGGYYGGGGGGASITAGGAGGGGGSDFCENAGALSNCAFGLSEGFARVTLTYVVADVPTAKITTPAEGATYALGDKVGSSFSCADAPGGAGIVNCRDAAGGGSGSAVDTSTTGLHSYTVTATSGDGKSSTTTVNYRVAKRPTAAIAAPTEGAKLTVGDHVLTSFSCTEGAGGTNITRCVDQSGRGSGAALDTAAPGVHTLTVTATSADGLTGSTAVHYTVVAPPSAPAPADQPADQKPGSSGGGTSTGGGSPGGKTHPGDGGAAGGGGAGGAGTGGSSHGGGRPSNAFSFTLRLRRPGAIRISVTLPAAGRVTAVGMRGSRRMTDTRSRGVRSAGATTLTLRLTAAARRALRAHRHVRIVVSIQYRPTGGTSRTRHKTVRL
jgi:hypothetical protein